MALKKAREQTTENRKHKLPFAFIKKLWALNDICKGICVEQRACEADVCIIKPIHIIYTAN